ncbi:hypothetical protein BJX99DRAFT_220574 [Aspergillus californicus]
MHLKRTAMLGLVNHKGIPSFLCFYGVLWAALLATSRWQDDWSWINEMNAFQYRLSRETAWFSLQLV